MIPSYQHYQTHPKPNKVQSNGSVQYSTGAMNMTRVFTSTFTAVLLLLVVTGSSDSDLVADETQCRDQLLSLTPCLGFVSGQARSPSPQCCSVLSGKLNATKKCLCILVKDRNEPGLGLGLEINATLALSLPSMCHTQSNASKCIDLLGLSPTSQAAQVFIQFDKNEQAKSGKTTSVASASTMSRLGWYGNAEWEPLPMLLRCLVFVLAWLLSL